MIFVRVEALLNYNVESTAGALIYPFLMQYHNGKHRNSTYISDDLLGVKVDNADHLVVKLKRQNSFFLNLLVLPVTFPQRQDIVNEYRRQYNSGLSKMIFNGQFILEKWSTQ